MFWILITGTLFSVMFLIKSGINLLIDQSPPPITFPALSVLMLISFEIKK